MKTRKGVKVVRATQLRMEPKTHMALRIAALQDGISMNDAINQGIRAWLKERRKKARKGVHR